MCTCVSVLLQYSFVIPIVCSRVYKWLSGANKFCVRVSVHSVVPEFGCMSLCTVCIVCTLYVVQQYKFAYMHCAI